MVVSQELWGSLAMSKGPPGCQLGTPGPQVVGSRGPPGRQLGGSGAPRCRLGDPSAPWSLVRGPLVVN